MKVNGKEFYLKPGTTILNLLEELKLKLKQYTEKLLNEYENDLSKHIF